MEGAISIARVTCHSPNDTHYSRPSIYTYTRVCHVPIGPLVADKLARECIHVCHIFAFLANFTLNIPRVKAKGKKSFFQLVSRPRYASQQHRFLSHNVLSHARISRKFSSPQLPPGGGWRVKRCTCGVVRTSD